MSSCSKNASLIQDEQMKQTLAVTTANGNGVNAVSISESANFHYYDYVWNSCANEWVQLRAQDILNCGAWSAITWSLIYFILIFPILQALGSIQEMNFAQHNLQLFQYRRFHGQLTGLPAKRVHSFYYSRRWHLIYNWKWLASYCQWKWHCNFFLYYRRWYCDLSINYLQFENH